MELYKITLCYNDGAVHSDFFVVAKDRQEACELVLSSWRDWKYSSSVYIGHTSLIAQEGQYGNPQRLLVSKPKVTGE